MSTRKIIALVLAFIVGAALVYNALCCGLDDRGHLAAALIIFGIVATVGVSASRMAYRRFTRRDASRNQSIREDQ